MNDTYYSISSLAMDLKRVALGYHAGSYKTAKRFSQEALKRKSEIDTENIKPYLQKLLQTLPKILEQQDVGRVAEDALMYSTLFQNYAVTHMVSSKTKYRE